MTCWIPSEYKDGKAHFALDYCYIQNTYVVPAADIDVSLDRDKYTRVNYYQWLALYFVVQAMVFYLPSYIWRRWYKNYDIDVTTIIKKTKTFREIEGEDKKKALKEAGLTVLETIRESRQISPRGNFSKMVHGSRPTLLTLRYLFVKVLNLVIVAVAITQVAGYLDNHDFFWSVQGINALITGTPWVDSANFPRVTMCDFTIRNLANPRNATIQCLLGMNYVNEKLFFVEWIWLFFVLIAASMSVMHFIYNIFTTGCRYYKLQSWLNPPKGPMYGKEEIALFSEVIGLDGFLTLYFIECHNGRRAAADFAKYLFNETLDEMGKLRCEKVCVEPANARKWPALFPYLINRSSKEEESPIIDSAPGSPPNTPHDTEAPALPEKEPIV